MEYTGDLTKMRVVHQIPIQYYLELGDQEIDMNEIIGQDIQIRFDGIIHCIVCGRTIKKAFGQGFCYPCFMNAPENSECIIRPELCLAHERQGRDPEWEEKNHNVPHYVYLALTSGIKVGVTRENQVPVRWIDQGAWKAIKLVLTPFRQTAGIIESELKNFINDKTPWRQMLKNESDNSLNMIDEKEKAIKFLKPEHNEYLIRDDNEIYTFEYPVLKYPSQVKSIDLNKTPGLKGKLTGIRGQYLILDNQYVINLRKHSGYEITILI